LAFSEKAIRQGDRLRGVASQRELVIKLPYVDDSLPMIKQKG
jgi:hypothetical protein